MKSIFYKLLLTFILVSIIPIVCITYISYSTSSNIMNNTVGQSVQQTVTQINTSIEMMLSSIENMANTMLFEDVPEYDYNIVKNMLVEYQTYDEYSGAVKRKQLEHYLSKFSSFQRFIESMYIVGTNGFSFSSPNQLQSNITFESFEWYESFKNSDKNVQWTELHNTQDYSVGSNSNVISYMKKVNNRVNTVNLGIFWVDINERWFSNIYNKMGITPSTQVFIINDKGHVLSHSDRTQIGSVVSYQDYLEPVFENNKGYYLGKVNNVDTIIAYDVLYKTQWKTICIIPVAEVMKPYIHEKDNMIFISVVLGFIITGFIFLLSYSISFPLKNLMGLMRKAASGDFNVRAISKSQDEVGQLCGMFNRMVEDIDHLIKQVYEARARQKEAELISLQSQINPHFLYNTLQTIKWLADFHKAPDIGKIAIALSKILRFSIKAERKVSIRDEINNTIDYITIQKYRYEDKFNVEWEVSEDVYDVKVPNLILQPIVENAIRHGLELKGSTGNIKIICKKLSENIIIEVKDNGLGMSEERLYEIRKSFQNDVVCTDKASIGLKNIYDRLKLMYGNEASLQIKSSEAIGTSVVILFPFQELRNTYQIDKLPTLYR